MLWKLIYLAAAGISLVYRLLFHLVFSVIFFQIMFVFVLSDSVPTIRFSVCFQLPFASYQQSNVSNAAAKSGRQRADIYPLPVAFNETIYFDECSLRAMVLSICSLMLSWHWWIQKCLQLRNGKLETCLTLLNLIACNKMLCLKYSLWSITKLFIILLINKENFIKI